MRGWVHERLGARVMQDPRCVCVCLPSTVILMEAVTEVARGFSAIQVYIPVSLSSS